MVLASNLDCIFVITVGVAFRTAFGAAGVEGWAGRSSWRIVPVVVAFFAVIVVAVEVT